jgi:anti-anti-sigma factor
VTVLTNRLFSDITASGGVTRVTVRKASLGEVDAGILAEALSRYEGRHLCLDLAAVESLSGSVLGVLISMHQRCRSAGGELVLENVTPFVYEIFAITHLTTVLQIRRRPVRAAVLPPTHWTALADGYCDCARHR